MTSCPAESLHYTLRSCEKVNFNISVSGSELVISPCVYPCGSWWGQSRLEKMVKISSFFLMCPKSKQDWLVLNLICKEAVQTKGICLGKERADQVI